MESSGQLHEQISWEDFTKVELRIGTILKAENLTGLRNPAYALEIDFGEFGIKKSSAQITNLYTKEELVGKQILGVINFPKKQIGHFFSEVLTCGFYLPSGEVVLAQPERMVPNGSKLG